MADIEVTSEFIAESEQFRSELASMESAVDAAAASIDRTTAAVRVGVDTRLAQTALEQFVQSAEAQGLKLRVEVATPPAYATPAARTVPPPASVPAQPVSRPSAVPVSAPVPQANRVASPAIAAPTPPAKPPALPAAETPQSRIQPAKAPDPIFTDHPGQAQSVPPPDAIPPEAISRDPSPAPPITHVVIPPNHPASERAETATAGETPTAPDRLIPLAPPTPRPTSELPERQPLPVPQPPDEVESVVKSPTSTPPVVPEPAPGIPRTPPPAIQAEELSRDVTPTRIIEPAVGSRTAPPEPVLPPRHVDAPVTEIAEEPTRPTVIPAVARLAQTTVSSSPSILPVPRDEPVVSKPPEAPQKPVESPADAHLTPSVSVQAGETAPAGQTPVVRIVADTADAKADIERLGEIPPTVVPVRAEPVDVPAEPTEFPSPSPIDLSHLPRRRQEEIQKRLAIAQEHGVAEEIFQRRVRDKEPMAAITRAVEDRLPASEKNPPHLITRDVGKAYGVPENDSEALEEYARTYSKAPAPAIPPDEPERFPAPAPIDLSRLPEQRREQVEDRFAIARKEGIAEEIFRRHVGDREDPESIAKSLEDRIPAHREHRPRDVVADTLEAYGVPKEPKAREQYRDTYHFTPATPERELRSARQRPEEIEFTAPAEKPSAPPFTEPLRQSTATAATTGQGAVANVEKEMAGLFAAYRLQLEQTAGIIKGMASDAGRATPRQAGGGGGSGPSAPAGAAPVGGGGRPPRTGGRSAAPTEPEPYSSSRATGQVPEEEGRGSIFHAGRIGRFLTAGFALQEGFNLVRNERQFNLSTLAAAGDPREQAEADLNRTSGIAKFVNDPTGEKEFVVKDTIRQADADQARAERRRDAAQEVAHARRTTAIESTGGFERERLSAEDQFKLRQEALQKEKQAATENITADYRKEQTGIAVRADVDTPGIIRSAFDPHNTGLEKSAIEAKRQADIAASEGRQAKEQHASDEVIKAKEVEAARQKATAISHAEANEQRRAVEGEIRTGDVRGSAEEARSRLAGKPIEAQQQEFQRQLEDQIKSTQAAATQAGRLGDVPEQKRLFDEAEARRRAKPVLIEEHDQQLKTQERLKDIASQHEVAQTTASADEELRRAQGDVGGAAQATLERENADRVKRLNEEADALKNVNAKESDRISKLSEAEKAAGATRQQALTTAQAVRQTENVSDIGVATQAERLRASGKGVAARELEADEPFKERIRELRDDTTRQGEADALEQEREAAKAERQAGRHEGATRIRAQARETQLRTDRKPFSAELAGIDERNRERLRELGGDREGTIAQQELHRQGLREFLKPKPEGGGQGSFLDRKVALQASVFSAFGKDAVNARRAAQQELTNTNKKYGRDADHLLSSEKAGMGAQSNSSKTNESLDKTAKNLEEAVARLNDFTQYFGAVGIA